MSEIEFEYSQSLSRSDAAKLLATLAEQLGAESHSHLRLGDSTVKLLIPEQVRAEIEIEVDGGEVELEIELKWSLGAQTTRSRKANTST